MTNQLEVWANDFDAVICHGDDDIVNAMIECNSCYEEEDRESLQRDLNKGGFKQTPDTTIIKIMQTTDSDVLQQVPVMTVVPLTDNDGLYIFQYRVSLTARQWIDLRGRCHLYTTEY